MNARKHLGAFEVIGGIAILQLPDEKKSRAKSFAEKILNSNKHIKTVALKTGKVSGRLRKRGLKVIAGIKNLETIHRESNCLMKLNVEKCYFSPRLSNERIEIAEQVKAKKSKKSVLVMFAGIAPFALVMAKQNPKAEIVAIEVNREACRYAQENVKLNKLHNLNILQGDVKKVVQRLKRKFDFIVMPRPQLKETFLKEAFKVSKKGTKIFYYDFAKQQEIEDRVAAIKKEAGKAKKKIKILKIKKAGEIAPYKSRIRVDFVVI
jgi:tRNA (guanine37-N1)-methyltransferase